MDNGTSTTKINLTVDTESAKMKLGAYLADNLDTLSRMYLRELIRDGKCEVNGTHVNSGYKLRPNDFIEVEADMSRGTAMQPEDIAIDILYEDDDLVIVDKPAGMLVHPSHRDKNGTLLNALAFHVNKDLLTQRRKDALPPPHQRNAATPPQAGGEPKNADSSFIPHPSSLIRPGLPHRLDKQTSGLMVVAKNSRAHRILSGHFMKKRVEKRYLALVDGVVADDEGTIEAPIGRFADLKYWAVKADGKHSTSHYWVRERFRDTTLIEMEPVTGRTNQLRIHCEVMGHPIVGDMERGGREFPRLCLHAYKLAFQHPSTSVRMEFETLLPDKFGVG